MQHVDILLKCYLTTVRILAYGTQAFITVARDRVSDSERLLYFGRVSFSFFSVHQIFDVPGPIIAKLCHTTRYVLK